MPLAKPLDMLCVRDVMTAWPVAVGPDRSVAEARHMAETWGVHHLMVTLDDLLIGVICQCDLSDASDRELVEQHMQSPFVFVSPDASVEVAAATMVAQGVGCLPVLDEGGRLAGLVTRRDLRHAGALPGTMGFDACAACGETHALVWPARGGAVVFCAACIDRAQPPGDFTVTTLGGSD